MYQQILEFWFEELKPAMWWKKDEQLDQLIRQRFGALHRQAASGELWQWRAAPEGRLAEIILLDQFSRNMHRDRPESFAQDGMALVLAQEAIAAAADLALPVSYRNFLYMPFMHSESLAIHERAVVLFSTPGMEGNLDFELRHRDILQRFGRYPHRNKILGRTSTEEELVFLTQPGSSF
ncbi:MAG: DUF924 family protein [Pseudomonas sp.]